MANALGSDMSNNHRGLLLYCSRMFSGAVGDAAAATRTCTTEREESTEVVGSEPTAVSAAAGQFKPSSHIGDRNINCTDGPGRWSWERSSQGSAHAVVVPLDSV